ncbi:MAG: UDP-N-acetylmuramoyl-L-alanyl-D-glutamate--2,6-diaminopimelate ligase [Clostridia bacterium]|nr:UDP-N-acetylmuramoyl-L-alanyl-D-glutamate--2,6-diaminopimelate ligase [Clostridia bacterium]
MKLSTLLKDVETLNVYEDVEVERVTDNNKENLKNALYVCIDGNRVDGHSLAKSSIESGAVAVLTSCDLGIVNQVIVKDTRCAYAKISANFYENPAAKLKLIGVTGTNGKTSTAFFIKGILENLGKKCGIIGTVKNDTGNGECEATLTTPEPMKLHKFLRQMVDNGCEYCVMEVSSQGLHQERVYGLQFKGAVLTNITPEHLDYHSNMKNYIDAKLRLFNMSDFACVNIDDDNTNSILNRINCPYKTISAISNNADYTAKNIVCNENGVRYEFVGMDCIGRIELKIPGKFTVYNSLCAVVILLNLGFKIDDISNACKNLDYIKGRAEIVKTPKKFTVMIDYAHTPDGLKSILESVREFTKGRVITVFGCGGDRDKSKRAEMGRIAGALSEITIVTSDNPRNENPILIINDILYGMEKVKSRIAVIENRRQAIEFALSKARAGDLVLLAGKGHENYQIIGNEKKPFDEKQIVKEYFNKI